MADRWCVLRTGPARTITLLRSLQAAGIAAWTPVVRVDRRLPRSKVTTKLEAPALPTYVFASEANLEQLRRLAEMDVSGHPAFSIFRYNGGTVFVASRALDGLRQMEQDSYRSALPIPPRQPNLKGRGEPFRKGQTITMSSGPMAGLTCTVEHSDGRKTSLVLRLFGRESRTTIETCQLRRDDVAHSHIAA